MSESRLLAASVVALAVSMPLAVQAQARSPCPGEDAATPDGSDPVAAADQAACWFELERRSSPECQSDGEDISRCVSQAGAWCDVAALDSSLQVANACFLARVRLGRYDDAARLIPLLTQAWPESEVCRRAMSEPMPLRVETDPPRAAITVSGRLAGRAPIDVTVDHPWWQQRVAARFENGSDALVERGPAALTALFDRRACTLRPMRIVDASRGRRSRSTTTTPRVEESSHGRGSPAAGIAIVGGGVAALGAGTVLLVIAQGRASEIGDAPDGSYWTDERESDRSSLVPFRVLGASLIGAGVLAAAAGVVVWTGLLDSEVGGRRDTARIGVGVGSVSVSGSF